MPDHPDLADLASQWKSAYVHIPFCAQVCPYCDFAVVEGADDQMEAYIDALVAEIETEADWHTLDAVFVGGGTPSRVPVGGLKRVLDALSDRFGLADDAEVSLEANPEDWIPELSSGLVECGFNRVSFGVQSFDAVVLGALGRRHDPDQATAAIRMASASGFGSVSADLIFGHPAETAESWSASLDHVVDSGVDHVSTYSLTVEPGTVLWKDVRNGAPAPDADVQADRWEAADDRLSSAGYRRYEVSNAARPGHACRYNLSVWGQGEYLGFGLGAHGYRDGVRSRRVRRLDIYIDRARSGVGPIQATDVIEGWDKELERLMLGLRRTSGVSAGDGGAALLSSDAGERLLSAGVFEVSAERLVVTRPLLTDEVIRAVLDL